MGYPYRFAYRVVVEGGMSPQEFEDFVVGLERIGADTLVMGLKETPLSPGDDQREDDMPARPGDASAWE